MTTSIHPQALKQNRVRKHWTQENLAEATKGKNKVSLPTIKRIEGTKNGSYQANDRVAESLAKALGVTVDVLSKPPTDEVEREASLRQFGYLTYIMTVRRMISGDVLKYRKMRVVLISGRLSACARSTSRFSSDSASSDSARCLSL